MQVKAKFLVTAMLFEFLTPMIGRASIQLANGEDGHNRRKMYDRAYAHDKLCSYFSIFQRVRCFLAFLPSVKSYVFFNLKGMTKSHIFVNSKSRFNFTFLNHHGKPQIAACSQSRKGRMVESLLILTFWGKKLRGDCFNTCLILDRSQRYYFHVSIFHFPLSSFNVFFYLKVLNYVR